MTNFSTENMNVIISKVDNIRNISIIAHVDHGKTTLADCLIGHGERSLDINDEEKKRGITIKSTSISLIYTRKEEDDKTENIECTDETHISINKVNKLEKNISLPSKNKIVKYKYNKYLINLIDSPGHIEFSAEVTGALRLTDGAIIVVDCIEGPKCQTETVLKQAIKEKVKPILFLNKIDRIFNNCKDLNDLYKVYCKFRQIIEKINSIIKIYDTNELKMDSEDVGNNNDNNNELSPSKGNVCFGSGLQGFGFTLADFAKMYYNDNLYRKFMVKGSEINIFSKKYNKWYKGKIVKVTYNKNTNEEWLNTVYKVENGDIISKEVQRYSSEIKPLNNYIDNNTSIKILTNKLWGENYWLPNEKKWWKKKNINDKIPNNALHGFTYFILYPLKKLFDSFNNNNINEYELIIQYLNIKNINNKEINIIKKKYPIMKPKDGYYAYIMKHWLNCGDCLFNAIINHLPSPKLAQINKINHLYTGPLNSNECKILKECNKDNYMFGFISKTIYIKGLFISVCRIFSGIIKQNMIVKVINSNYIPGESNYIDNIKIQRIVLFNGNELININECYPGNICGIIGLSDYIPKSGTITNIKPILVNNKNTIYPFINMKFTVSNIVKIGINCESTKNLNKLNDALKKLEKTDPLIKIIKNDTGQRLLSGSGELHLDVCFNELQNNLLKNVDIKLVKTKPIVSFCETIINKSSFNIISKSINKHNRIKLNGNGINKDMLNIIDNNIIELPKFNNNNSMKLFGNELYKRYGFEYGSKIWTFGCIENKNTRNNIFVNKTKGVEYLSEIKDNLKQGFIQGTLNGVLCNDNLRGIQFNLLDCKIHSDPAHRKSGQIINMIKRGMNGVQLCSSPRLLQPIYEISIEMPFKYQKNILGYLYNKKGNLINIKKLLGNNILLIGTLPIIESFGFIKNIKEKTKGEGFLNMNFSHWEIINSDPFSNNNIKDNDSIKYIIETRKRKGLNINLPKLNDYHDKMDW